MTNVIWTAWLAGRASAPPDVQARLAGWEQMNPGWELRCLDAVSVERYAPLREHLELNPGPVGAASFSEVLRLAVLHEFGGVWIDPGVSCRRPLNDWLPGAMIDGFFAFAEPDSERDVAPWFLSAEFDSALISAWLGAAVEYWSRPAPADDRFWFGNLFRELCRRDRRAAEAWARVPALSASELVVDEADAGRDRHQHARYAPVAEPAAGGADGGPPFAALSVSTENLGDHIQIQAGLSMLSRLGITPTRHIDRDHEVASASVLAQDDGKVPILLNGWFKSNRSEWPPHPKLAPLMLGFHIRLFQCPELLSDDSLAYFRRHGPVGCRDVYTETLLRSNGVDAFTSNCLSLVLPRRIATPRTQSKLFVVSRDERIKDRLPPSLGAYTFVSHYSGSSDFEANMTRAAQLLQTYRTQAKLVVTTLLHCALPAIAMGIPVVVFYPLNEEALHESDRERFSSLESMIRIHRFDELDGVDWNPAPVDASAIKLQILDRFYEMARRWAIPASAPRTAVARA